MVLKTFLPKVFTLIPRIKIELHRVLVVTLTEIANICFSAFWSSIVCTWQVCLILSMNIIIYNKITPRSRCYKKLTLHLKKRFRIPWCCQMGLPRCLAMAVYYSTDINMFGITRSSASYCCGTDLIREVKFRQLWWTSLRACAMVRTNDTNKLVAITFQSYAVEILDLTFYGFLTPSACIWPNKSTKEMRFNRKIPFLVFSGILIGYIILLPPEIVFFM